MLKLFSLFLSVCFLLVSCRPCCFFTGKNKDLTIFDYLTKRISVLKVFPELLKTLLTIWMKQYYVVYRISNISNLFLKL